MSGDKKRKSDETEEALDFDIEPGMVFCVGGALLGFFIVYQLVYGSTKPEEGRK